MDEALLSIFSFNESSNGDRFHITVELDENSLYTQPSGISILLKSLIDWKETNLSSTFRYFLLNSTLVGANRFKSKLS